MPKSETFVYFTNITTATWFINRIILVSIALRPLDVKCSPICTFHFFLHILTNSSDGFTNLEFWIYDFFLQYFSVCQLKKGICFLFQLPRLRKFFGTIWWKHLMNSLFILFITCQQSILSYHFFLDLFLFFEWQLYWFFLYSDLNWNTLPCRKKMVDSKFRIGCRHVMNN